MSAGQPTKLVRDGSVESYEEAPDEPPSREAVRIEHPDAAQPGDLRRADAAEARGLDNVDPSGVAFDKFAESQID